MQVQRVQLNNVEKLKNLKLNDITISKILSAKTTSGKDVFNKNGVKILEKTAKIKDNTFFSNIMKNLDGIEFVKKKFNPFKLSTTYEMQSHKGMNGISSIMTVSLLSAKTIIDTVLQKGNETTRNYRINDKHFISEGVQKTVNNKLVEDYDVFFDKDENSITRRRFNNSKRQEEKKTMMSENGVIKSITLKQYETKNILGYSIKENNFDKNVFTQTNAILKDAKELVKSAVLKVQNPYTKKNETIKMELSDIDGVYNSTITDNFGNNVIESIAKKSLDGSINIKKNFESLDGTKTVYNYQASKDGNNINMFYQIKDVNGEVLTTVDRTFKRINPNLAFSSINGHKYKIETTDKLFKITDYSKNEIKNILKTDFGRSATIHPEIFDKMSADMILDLHKKGYKYNFIYDDSASCIEPANKELNTGSNMYSFAHEQGHTKDIESNVISGVELVDSKISSNPVLKKTYEQERLAFIKAFADIPQEQISYFIDKKDHYMGKDGGLMETVAEINAILSTATGKERYASREYFLQKYFPRTIAVASKLLMPNSNLYVTNS